MEQEIQKLQKGIISLMENSKRIQNSNDITECLKNIQLRLISRLIARARAKINYIMAREKCNTKFQA